MATIVAAAGGGNWTTGATWVGGVAPTAADDAVLNGTSGNVTIVTGSVCRSLDCTGYTGTLSVSGTNTLTIGHSTAGAGNIALKLVAGMTASIASYSHTIIFASTSATQQTITTAGKFMGNITFSGAGSSYLLTDSLDTTNNQSISHTAGTLNTNGQTVYCRSYSTSGAGTKVLTLGSSTLTFCQFFTIGGSNLTLNAGTSTITTDTVGGAFSPAMSVSIASLTFNIVTIDMGAGTGSNTFQGTYATLSVTGGTNKASTVSFTSGVTTTVTGTLTLNGNSAVNRLFVRAATFGTAATVSAATVVTQSTDWQGITTAGAANWNLSSITGGSGDCGGCTGITFTTATTCYAVNITGTAGLWSTHAWMTASGGATPTRVPLPQDTAILDANSGAGTKFSIDMPRISGFTWNRPAMELAATVALAAYGDFNVVSALSITGAFALALEGRGSHTISLGGLTHPSSIAFNGIGGTYTVGSGGLRASTTITHSRGTLDTNGNAVSCTTFTSASSQTRSLTLGASTVTVTATSGTVWNIQASGLTFSGASGTVTISAASASTRTVVSTGTLGTLNYTVAGSTGQLTLTNSFTVGTLNITDASNGRTISFSGTITIATLFNVSGSASGRITLAGSGTFSKASGIVSADWLNISANTASGGATWYAGANSIGSGTGWTMSAPPSLSANPMRMMI